MGGIIVWPKDSDPSTSSNIWLECNGQTYDTSRFPKLYKVLGSNRVPNYQGMFLRGAGSQNFSQVNGLGYDSNDDTVLTNGSKTSTQYTSGDVGSIQGDSTRRFIGGQGTNLLGLLPNAYTQDEDWKYISYLGNKWMMPRDGASYRGGLLTSSYSNSPYNTDPLHRFNAFIYTTPKHYRYKLNYSVSSDEDGNQVIDNISLDEYTSPAESDEGVSIESTINALGYDTAIAWPTSNEIRPVNIAVKYYIRAK